MTAAARPGMIRIPRPDGGDVPGYLALPPGGDAAPAVVILHEWWGLTEDVRGVADRLAERGYRALALDLFRGHLPETPLEGMRRLKSFDFIDAADQDLRGALRHLKAGGGRAATLGFSLGGAVAIIAAAVVRECDAVLSFYGIPRAQHADPGAARVPVQAHLSMVDEWYPPRVLDRFEARLREASAPVECFRYDARHGFFSARAGGPHDPTAAGAAWERSLAFLAAHLRGGGPAAPLTAVD